MGKAKGVRPDFAGISAQELTSRHAMKAPNTALPTANTTMTKLTNTPGDWVCVIQPKTMDNRLSATMSQKSGLRGWYKLLSFMGLLPGRCEER